MARLNSGIHPPCSSEVYQSIFFTMDQVSESAAQDSSVEEHNKRSPSPSAFRKCCDVCQEPHDVLIRCQIDDTATWHFICPKRCWKAVSGGVVDGDIDHPYYKYGGMWKNKHALVNAKKPKHKKKVIIIDWQPEGMQFTANDKARFEKNVWLSRRSHESSEENAPGKSPRLWMKIS